MIIDNIYNLHWFDKGEKTFFYVGVTNDPNRRFKEHQYGTKTGDELKYEYIRTIINGQPWYMEVIHQIMAGELVSDYEDYHWCQYYKMGMPMMNMKKGNVHQRIMEATSKEDWNDINSFVGVREKIKKASNGKKQAYTEKMDRKSLIEHVANTLCGNDTKLWYGKEGPTIDFIQTIQKHPHTWDNNLDRIKRQRTNINVRNGCWERIPIECPTHIREIGGILSGGSSRKANPMPTIAEQIIDNYKFKTIQQYDSWCEEKTKVINEIREEWQSCVDYLEKKIAKRDKEKNEQIGALRPYLDKVIKQEFEEVLKYCNNDHSYANNIIAKRNAIWNQKLITEKQDYVLKNKNIKIEINTKREASQLISAIMLWEQDNNEQN